MILKDAKFEDLTIKELTIGEFIPIVEKMTTNPVQAQMEMMQKCVYDASGNLMMEAVKTLPGSSYMALWNAIKELHGMNEKKD